MRLSSAAVLAILLAGPVLYCAGQCRSCGPNDDAIPGQRIVFTPPEDVQLDGQYAGYWKLGKGGYQYRYVNGSVVGAYDPDKRLWWPLINGEYSEEFAIPYERAGLRDKRNNGLELDKLSTARERVTIGGKAVELGEAIEALGSHEMPAYSRMARVTAIVRDPAQRARIEQDFAKAPELQALKGRVLFDVYAPDHWHVQPFGLERAAEFQTSGVALLFQGPPGPDARSKPYAVWSYPGPAAVAAAVEGMRQPAPGYDPSRIAPLQGPLSLLRIPLGVAALVVAGLVLLGMFVFRRR